MGTIFNQIPRCDMIGDGIKRAPDILFRITKKEAEFVKKLPRHQQDEFEVYLKLKYQFEIKMNKTCYSSKFYRSINK